MNHRFEQALLINVNDYGSTDLSRTDEDITSIEARIIAGGCPVSAITRLADPTAGRINTAFKTAVDRITGDKSRPRLLVAYAGKGAWDTATGPNLTGAGGALVSLHDWTHYLSTKVPDLGITLWLGAGFCGPGSGGPVTRTMTPAATPPADYPYLREIDRVIANSPASMWVDIPRPALFRGIGPRRGRPSQVIGIPNGFRAYDRTDTEGGSATGSMYVTDGTCSVSGTNLSSASEHWYPTSIHTYPDTFFLVPTSTSIQSISTPFNKYDHLSFNGGSTVSMPDVSALSGKVWHVSRKVAGTWTTMPLVVQALSTGALNFWAKAAAYDSNGFVLCASSEQLKFVKITSNPANMAINDSVRKVNSPKT